jgi:acyl-CoA synthetase (AMP-forming)/AMP-acid ligase II
MTPWTYAAIWESVAAAIPDELAIVQGDLEMTWRTFDETANGLAAHLLNAGISHQGKVAVYARNGPEYLIGSYAALKISAVPFNVNYRYGGEEVLFLLTSGDAEAVVFDAEFASLLDPVRARAGTVKTWIAYATPGHPVPDWATDLAAIAPEPECPAAPWPRSEDDQLFIFTGGTTGMPKAVMWRQGDLQARGNYGANPLLGIEPLPNPEAAGPRARALPVRGMSLIAPPLMHGTGMLTAFAALSAGATVLLAGTGHFDAEVIWDLAEKYQASRLTVVGQPFAQPLLEALDANPGRWDLSAMRFMLSSGAMWSIENKRGLIAHMPELTITDSFASSEALGLGASIVTRDEQTDTARFTLGPDCAVFAEDGRRIEPGSDETGKVAVGGPIPLGYYKDEAKTRSTFIELEGRRWSMPGDWATVAADGTLTLLGRGSQCINTGGEKVFPEEVEEVLKRHPAVRDAAVSGLPDPRFGERIGALAELHEAAIATAEELIEHVRANLSSYKAPRHVLIAAQIPRAPNGKMDYAAVKAQLVAHLGDTGW